MFSKSGGRHLPKIDIVFPDSPDDPGQFVGEGDGGLVVAACLLKAQSPGAQAVGSGALTGRPEDGACAMDEQHAEIDVATLADGAEAADETAGAFAGRQAQVAGEVTCGGEALHIADEGDQGGGSEETDAGDGTQTVDGGNLVGEGLKLSLDDSNATFQVADLVASFGEAWTQSVGQGGVGVGKQS